MSDVDKSVLDFDPVYTNKETDIEYIIRTTLAGRDKYAFTAVKKSRDRKALEEIYGKASVITQDTFIITGNADAEFSSNIDITVLFRYDFGGGEIPVLYDIEAFTDVTLTSGNPVIGGTTNYLYATFDPTVGVDGFFLHSTTTEPIDPTDVLLATYTATGAAGSFIITVSDIYPDGSIQKGLSGGFTKKTVNSLSSFYRIGDFMRTLMGDWDYVIDSDESLQAYLDNTTESYPNVLVMPGTWSGDITSQVLTCVYSDTLLIQGLPGATLDLTSVTNTSSVFNGVASDTPAIPCTKIRDTDFILQNITGGGHSDGIIRYMSSMENCNIVLDGNAGNAVGRCDQLQNIVVYKDGNVSGIPTNIVGFSNCEFVTDCIIDFNVSNGVIDAIGFNDCTRLSNCRGTIFGDSSDDFVLFTSCRYMSNCKALTSEIINSGAGNNYGYRTCSSLSTCTGFGSASYVDTSSTIS